MKPVYSNSILAGKFQSVSINQMSTTISYHEDMRLTKFTACSSTTYCVFQNVTIRSAVQS